MAAPTIEQIMDGIEVRLKTISGLNVSDVTPGQVTTPAAVVGLPEEIDYLVTYTPDRVDLNFRIMVMTSTINNLAGQKNLAAFMDSSGPRSILAAIDADQTLGGLVSYCVVQSAATGPIQFGTITYYGAVFTVNVSA